MATEHPSPPGTAELQPGTGERLQLLLLSSPPPHSWRCVLAPPGPLSRIFRAETPHNPDTAPLPALVGEGDRPTLASRRIQLGATQDWDGQDCRTRSHGHSLLRADAPLWTEKQEGASRRMSGPARLQEVDAAHRSSPNQLCHPGQGTLGGVCTSLFVTLGE